VHVLQRVHHGGHDHQSRVPLVVGRDDEPRRVLRGRIPDRVLVDLHVVVPELALEPARVGGIEVLETELLAIGNAIGVAELLRETPAMVRLSRRFGFRVVATRR
jgi:hypothetical protein